MKRFALHGLQESQSHLRQAFTEFAGVWQATRPTWRDEPARQFEQRYLSDLPAALKRVCAAAEEFVEQVRAADQVVSDPDDEASDSRHR